MSETKDVKSLGSDSWAMQGFANAREEAQVLFGFGHLLGMHHKISSGNAQTSSCRMFENM